MVERVQPSNDGSSVRTRQPQKPLDIECVRGAGFQEDIFLAIFRTLPARLRHPNLFTLVQSEGARANTLRPLYLCFMSSAR
jgi:hypothetical protein